MSHYFDYSVNCIKFGVYLGAPGGFCYFELLDGFNFDPYVCADRHKPMWPRAHRLRMEETASSYGG